MSFLNGVNLGRAITFGLPHSATNTVVPTLADRVTRAETEGLANLTFVGGQTYNFSYSGADDVICYISNPTITGTGDVTLTNLNAGVGVGTVTLYSAESVGFPTGNTQNIVSGAGVALEATPAAQPTRLFVDLSDLPDGTQYVLYEQPAAATVLTSANIIAEGTKGSTINFIAFTSDSANESVTVTRANQAAAQFTFTSSDAAFDAIFRPTGTGNVSTVMLAATHSSMRSNFYGINVIQNASPATVDPTFNSFTAQRGVDESLLLADSTAYNSASGRGQVARVSITETLAPPRPTNTIPISGSNGVRFDISGMGNRVTIKGITDIAGTVDAVVTFASPHGLIAGNTFTTADFNNTDFNETFTVSSVVNDFAVNTDFDGTIGTFNPSDIGTWTSPDTTGSGVTLGRPTESDAQLLIVSARNERNYAKAIAQAFRESPITVGSVTTTGNISATSGSGIAYDIVQFVNNRNVNMSPRHLFEDIDTPLLQFLPGVYRTSSDGFNELNLDQAVTLFTSLHSVTIVVNNVTSTISEEEVIAERRQVTDVTNFSIQQELNARLLTADNMGNLGLTVPVLAADGSLVTTPKLS